MKFYLVILDEIISWKDHIKTAENKLSKYIGLLYLVKQVLDKDSLKLYI